MTEIDKSPEQLSAEAAGRTPESLDSLIELHRAMFRDDSRIPRLATRQPPVIREEDGVRRTQWVHGSMPMSGTFHRRVFEERPGELFPWVTAFAALRVHCRRHHPQHRRGDRPYWRGALCHQAVRFTVVEGWTPEQTAGILRLVDIEPLLRSAFRTIEQAIDEQRARAEQRQKQDTGVFRVGETTEVHLHRPLPGLHAAECPQCRRNAA